MAKKWPENYRIRQAGIYHYIGWHPAHQGADVAVLESLHEPESNLNCLFTVGSHGSAVAAVLRHMNDPDKNFRFYLPRERSQSGTFGKPNVPGTAACRGGHGWPGATVRVCPLHHRLVELGQNPFEPLIFLCVVCPPDGHPDDLWCEWEVWLARNMGSMLSFDV